MDLRTLTRAAFGWRRKQLQKILRTADAYRLDAEELEAVARESGIEPERRPETLSPEEFVSLMRVLRRRGYPREGSPPGAPGGEPAMEGA